LDKRESAIEQLKKLIRDRRAQIDPAVLEKARLAAEKAGREKKKPAAPQAPPGTVPYDRESAQKAVELFLSGHPQQKEFSRRLIDMLAKRDH
jgi:hypothetical protein